MLKDYIEERVIEIANYIIDTGYTVRQVASIYKVSKSTVHKDITERLPVINPTLYERAREVLDKNKSERHLRGGMATKNKFKKLAE